ncbi:MAG: nicotinate phosphoribosyltransferase [Bacteroidetes bacterium]|nr:MAG: nicotinate phosphoribosyltransferase [Bacteroidota bacterium]PIE88584.1 MAG: nicotinate phosphoribosyltransferase [Bacteroidota bacterium]
MIQSFLDNDFYKFTMQNCVVKKFPRAKVRYQFIDRGETHFPDGFAEELQRRVNAMAGLKLTAEEKSFLSRRCYYLDPTYLDFLAGFRYDPSEITIRQEGGSLHLDISGYWYRTILWEVPLMALISSLYFQMTGEKTMTDEEVVSITRAKMDFYDKIKIKVADFGTRRRYSSENHDLIIRTLSRYYGGAFTGTSNVYFAMKYGVSPIGTHAHEWFMFHSAKYGFKMATKFSLEHWIDIYRGDLGIALADTFTTELFFRCFDTKFAKLFDGVRHDSGDPLLFASKIIAHYRKMGIDPASKTIIFSDGLTPDRVEAIANFCAGKIKISFGIGTDFTNDVGVTPLNIVIKMSEAKPEGQNWIKTVKLSDTPGKYTGDPDMIALCKRVLQIEG